MRFLSQNRVATHAGVADYTRPGIRPAISARPSPERIPMQLVMIETHGNQNYIFSSPRLRENIGASYQLTQLERWTEAALKQSGTTGTSIYDDWHGQHLDYGDDAPWVSRSSGKVILMTDTPEQARELIGRVTRRALVEAPGIDVSGVFVPMAGEHVTASDLRAVHREAAAYALSRPPASARFSQMPFLERAGDSSLPAAPPLAGVHDQDKKDKNSQDLYSLRSRVARHEAITPRKSLLERVEIEQLPKDSYELAKDPTELQKLLQPENDDDPRALSKVAVIHIDGNGVGAIMRDLEGALERVREAAPDAVTEGDDALRRFLLEVNRRLEEAVKWAFTSAWRDTALLTEKKGSPPRDEDGQARSRTVVPVVPVILGGDDVTVITDGDYALPFAESYLTHYEANTESDPLLKYLGGADGVGPMTAAAGVAVVRRNFPFHIAYDLAERLVESAKRVGKAQVPAISTLTYHVLFDTTVLDADEVLSAYKSFTTRPFLLNPDPARSAGTSAAQHPDWVEVCKRVNKFNRLTEEDEETGETRFPRARAARIRRFLSDAAQAQLRGDAATRKTIMGHAEREWRDAEDSLGSNVEAIGGITGLFDLLELSDLLPKQYLDNQLGRTSLSTAASVTQQSEEARA
ncbi:hypothetical protein [Actinomyces qiguomingii]|uniref:hypothetical protein n=1 Tax=Actinomyces qiguomingii TaxID=2057800 RepID=UPI001E40BC3D|nr:hypothetical protein [Actinomyces qiguomingii]